MTTRLRPMREDEFRSYQTRAVADYAADMVANGGWEAEAARRKSEQDFAQLFADGFASNVELRVIEDESGEVVGQLVWAEREQHQARHAFVYDLVVDERHRGRGHGRAALTQLEAEVRGRGLGQLRLHVFGGNDVARGLYRSLGYEEHSVLMGKRLR